MVTGSIRHHAASTISFLLEANYSHLFCFFQRFCSVLVSHCSWLVFSSVSFEVRFPSGPLLATALCVLQLHSDVDSGNGNIKYILSGEGAGTIFVIDDKTGNIHATKTLDREEQAQYTLTAQAVARDTNKPLEPPSEFIVKVQDINDNPPEFLHGPYYARVPEMSSVGESGQSCGAVPHVSVLFQHNLRNVHSSAGRC